MAWVIHAKEWRKGKLKSVHPIFAISLREIVLNSKLARR